MRREVPKTHERYKVGEKGRSRGARTVRSACGIDSVTGTVTGMGEVAVRLQTGLDAAKEVGENVLALKSGCTRN